MWIHVVAILMLGPAIGANVAVFGVVKGSTTALSGLTYTPDAYEEFRASDHSFVAA
jgi:hypothetical protein